MPVQSDEIALEIQPAWPVPAQRTQSTITAALTVPFLAFMAFIAVEEAVRLAASAGFLTVAPGALYYLYPVKAATAGALLWHFRRQYRDLVPVDSTGCRSWIAALLAGFLTFVLWVCMDWTLPFGASPAGFDPALLPAGPVRVGMVLCRVAGAVLVVPVIEELFWRSFLLRYLVAADFRSVPLGTFTWSSFLVAALLFGLEHHFFFAGVMAGVVYSLILYKTRSIAHCVLAHAVTNLSLACYVLYTGKWYFW